MSQTGYAYTQCAVIIYCDGMTYLLQEPALQKNSELRHHRTFGFTKMAPHADTIEKSLFIDTKETCSTEQVFFSFLQHIISKKSYCGLVYHYSPTFVKNNFTINQKEKFINDFIVETGTLAF